MDVAELAMMLSNLDPAPVTPQQMQEAAVGIGSIMNTLEQDKQLLLYGLFKQASVGDCNLPQPDDMMSAAGYKWNIWNSFKGFPQTDAAKAYVYLVEQSLKEHTACQQEIQAGTRPPQPTTTDTSELGSMAPTVSTLFKVSDGAQSWAEHDPLFMFVANDDEQQALQAIEEGSNVNATDATGMTPLHYAADRGLTSMCKLLLERGADSNIATIDGETPLMLATICEQLEVVELLLSFGADIKMKDSDGLCVFEYEGLSDEIREIFNKFV